MTPDDEEELGDDQPEKPTKAGKVGKDFLQAFEARKLGKVGQRKEYGVYLQAYAEDELARKEYKEMVCKAVHVVLKVLLSINKGKRSEKLLI